MWLTFSETSVFTRQITGLLSDAELNTILWALMANPERGDISMNDELFQQFAASLREGGTILRGTVKPARSTELHAPDARAIREKLGMSQTQFAALVGISARTLQNWEQGHRRPEGTARALLRVAERHPEAVLDALHR